MENIRNMIMIDMQNNDDDNDLHTTYPNVNMIQTLFVNITDAETASVSLKLIDMEFLRCLQEAMADLIRVKHNHYWSECFQQVVQMVASICGSGDQCADKVLRGTMLVDNIF